MPKPGWFTASPIAVRLLGGDEPDHVQLGDLERRDLLRRGILRATERTPRCDHATRNSFERLLPSTLFIHVFSDCSFDLLTVVSPGGVTCPAPEFSGCVRAGTAT